MVRAKDNSLNSGSPYHLPRPAMKASLCPGSFNKAGEVFACVNNASLFFASYAKKNYWEDSKKALCFSLNIPNSTGSKLVRLDSVTAAYAKAEAGTKGP